jgi:hypothetical protein
MAVAINSPETNESLLRQAGRDAGRGSLVRGKCSPLRDKLALERMRSASSEAFAHRMVDDHSAAAVKFMKVRWTRTV